MSVTLSQTTETVEVAAPSGRLWRGFLVGSALLPINTLWVFYLESIGGHGPFVSTISMFFNVIFLVFFLALANLGLQRLRPRLALNRGEMIIVYVMLTLSTSLMSHDMMQVLVSMMTTGYWFATPQNHWNQLLDGTTPSWLVISDQGILYGYWNGNTTLYQRVVLEAWTHPILWWFGFVAVLIFVLICLSVLFRPLWSDRERLTFPIIQLPLELTDPKTRLFTNPLLWIGFGVGASVSILNGLNAIFPAVPAVPLYIDLQDYIKNDPWNGTGWFPMTFNPAIIGLGFLMPLDLLFSCTIFYLYWKMLYVVARAMAYSQGYGWGGASESVFPFANEQMFGALLAVSIGGIVMRQAYFREVWKRIVSRRSELDDRQEGMSFRTALLGVIVGIGLLAWFAMHGGLAPSLAIIFFVIYFLLAIAIGRVRAEFGSPLHDFHWTGPDYILNYLVGSANLSQRDLGMFHQLYWFNRAYRGHPEGPTIEGLQMGAVSRTSRRAIIICILLGALGTVVAGFWGWLHFAYKLGAGSAWGYGAQWFGQEAYGRLQSWVESPKDPNLTAPFAMAAGFGISLLLTWCRTQFIGWPLHPMAYALTASWSINWVWMPMFIAWVLKGAILRYGGLRSYRHSLPFFYGLILGESLLGCSWSLIGLLFHVPSYSFFGS